MPIRFGPYKIRNGRNGGLALDLRGVSQVNIDLRIFQDTKLTNGIYTCGSVGYSIVATDTPSRHCSGVSFFYRLSPHFAVEAIQKFGPDTVGSHMTAGERQWCIIGCYLIPDNTLTIYIFVAALNERPQGAELLVAGDFNVKLLDPEGGWKGEEIAVVLTAEGLEDMLVHFPPRWFSWFRDGRTWSMVQAGREVRSGTDYILGTYCCLFCHVSIRDPRHNSDHYMILGCLHSAPLR